METYEPKSVFKRVAVFNPLVDVFLEDQILPMIDIMNGYLAEWGMELTVVNTKDVVERKEIHV